MRLHRKTACFLLAVVVFTAVLFGCGGTDPENRPSKPQTSENAPGISGSISAMPTAKQTLTPTNIPTPTYTPTPSPSPTPIRIREEYSLDELYPDKPADTLYRMHLDQYIKNCYIGDIKTNNGFVLVTAYRNSCYSENPPEEEPTNEYGRVLLFHVSVPEIVMVKSFSEEIYGDPVLFEDGSFMLYFWGGLFRAYDMNMQETASFEVPGGSLFAATDDKNVWVKTGSNGYSETAAFHLYSIQGEKLASYDAGSFDIHKFLYDRDGKGYFAAFRPDFSDYLVNLDYATGQFNRVDGLHIENDCYEKFLEYSTDTTWYYTLDGQQNTVYAIPKFSKSEISQSHLNGKFASAEWFFTDDDEYYTVYRVYDVADLTLLGILSTKGIPDLINSGGAYLTDEGYVLFDVTFSNEDYDLFLWDVTAENPQLIEDSRIIEPTEDTLELRAYAKRFQDEFGISVYFEEVDMHGKMFNNFRLIPCEDHSRLLQMMQELYEVITIFPDGFWTDILADGEKDAVRFFLCDCFERTGLSVIEEAAALTNSSTNEICMAYGTRYMGQFKTTFVHETMHMMEVRINKFCEENDLDFYDYWQKKLNTTKYGYHDSYTDDKGNSIEDYSGTYYDKPSEAWFIDAYSRSNEREDRARVLENLYSRNYFYFKESKHLLAKAQNLCAIIRAAFPSVRDSNAEMPWEYDIGVLNTAEYLEKYKDS